LLPAALVGGVWIARENRRGDEVDRGVGVQGHFPRRYGVVDAELESRESPVVGRLLGEVLEVTDHVIGQPPEEPARIRNPAVSVGQGLPGEELVQSIEGPGSVDAEDRIGIDAEVAPTIVPAGRFEEKGRLLASGPSIGFPGADLVCSDEWNPGPVG
jgi:hypothetical protein